MAAPSSGPRAGSNGVIATSSMGVPEQILVLLELNRVAIADQLVNVLTCFRGTQQQQLLLLLQALATEGRLDHVITHFDRKLDVKDEMDRYLQDLLKMHHYITHHNVDADISTAMIQLYGAFGDRMDRQLVTKVFQTIGFSTCCATFCFVCAKLPFKYQQELLTLFADDLPELRTWMQWLAKVNHGTADASSGVSGAAGDSDELSLTLYNVSVEFFVKIIYERCTFSWLSLLKPLPHTARVAVVKQTYALSMHSMKQLARFYETSGVSVQQFLDLDPAVVANVTTLLDQFPVTTLLTLFTKFNTAKLIHCILGGLHTLTKKDLLELIDTLGVADNEAIDLFVGALFGYARVVDFTRLFLTFTAQNRSRFLDLLLATAKYELPAADENEGDKTDEGDKPNEAFPISSGDAAAWLAFDLFMNAHFNSYDIVIQKLSTLPKSFARQMITSIARYTTEELALLGEGIEAISIACLPSFPKLFAALMPTERHVLVQWVLVVPGDEATPIYDVLLAKARLIQDGSNSAAADNLANILNLITTLTLKDKIVLCTEVLLGGPHGTKSTESLEGIQAINETILLFVCTCTISVHKLIKLLRILPAIQYEAMIFLLRTQRIPEQVVLTRLMLSLPSDANCRLLAKVCAFSTDVLDLFFEVLLLIPKVEYRMLAKLLVSPNVSSDQLQSFIRVAASLMNQASTRELVIFTAELPITVRNMFFTMLATDPVKGVLLRIVACSSKLRSDVLHCLIEVLHPLSWGTRSSFVEQIRVLEETSDIQELIAVAQDLEPTDLEVLVLLLNILQVRARITFTSLFVGLARHEKHLALTKLNAMPRDRVQSYCATICGTPTCDLSIGTTVFRVFGLLESTYQHCLLQLLEHESCWSLLTLMGDCVLKKPDARVLNGFAASLLLFTKVAEFLVLRSVVQEALMHGTVLEELVLVLCHFRDPITLLEFLKFVHHLSKFTRSTVLFRVLAKYKQTRFLYEMCRVLDLDDALFALKRLDRLWQQRSNELEHALQELADNCRAGGVARVKDEFCNVILGFHELRSKDDGQHNSKEQRHIVPRTAPMATDPQVTKDTLDDDQEDLPILFLPLPRPVTHAALSLEQYLRRTRSQDVLAANWDVRTSASPATKSTRLLTEPASGDCTASIVGLLDDGHNKQDSAEISVSGRCDPDDALDDTSANSNVFALTETASLPPIFSPYNSGRRRSSHEVPESTASQCEQPPSSNTIAEEPQHAADDLSSRAVPEKPKQQASTTMTTQLPPLVLHPQTPTSANQSAEDGVQHVSSRGLPSPTGFSSNTTTTSSLSRSESAPATISSSSYTVPDSDKPKRYRGLAPALERVSSDFHVNRDRGASIFKKECSKIEANGPSRIRVAKSINAQSHIMAVRAQHALGKKHLVATSLPSPLLRPDRHIFEKANAAIATATVSRTQSVAPEGFVIAKVSGKKLSPPLVNNS
uniref:Uncharacterized protein n=1 Tax=Globisporangium ultimum (strain ATCC 200006 / CBS 805.95 / DAOM BR144) TaxID=431595 RepID=K3X5W4_GLOUD